MSAHLNGPAGSDPVVHNLSSFQNLPILESDPKNRIYFFDIDETIRTLVPSALMTMEGERHFLDQAPASDRQYRWAREIKYNWAYRKYFNERGRLTETCLPKVISDLREKGALVFGLSSRPVDTASETVSDLMELDIEFSPLKNVPNQPLSTGSRAFPHGFILTSGQSKSDAAASLLCLLDHQKEEKGGYCPTDLVVVDDKMKYLTELKQRLPALVDNSIRIHLLQYTGATSPTLASANPTTFAYQQKRLLEDGVMLSDGEAIIGVLKDRFSVKREPCLNPNCVLIACFVIGVTMLVLNLGNSNGVSEI